MNNTLRTLSTLITPQVNDMNIEQLAVAYQKDENPSVFAAAFHCVFNLANTVASNYFGLSSPDIASFTLETLDSCLKQYNPQKGAFSTIFTVMLKNKLRTETQALNTQKRKIFMNSCSLEDLVELSNFDIETFDVDSVELIIDILQSYELTEMEQEYCRLLMEGNINKDISNMLGVSVMTLCNMRKSLRIKIAPMISL